MSLNITPKDLLDAGVHFGHQTKRWNPRSKPFVFDHRQGISIIDLGKTHAALEKAVTFLENTVANGGNVLLVGTKRQAKEIIREAAAATTNSITPDSMRIERAIFAPAAGPLRASAGVRCDLFQKAIASTAVTNPSFTSSHWP
jgi:hypothetical protein